ncbi:MAG: polysaccharide biosynthesis/export family protein [Bacteroidetes bacterium]|nr:polysaccharide biosynthesis/export family protein [Bacteroidota bacterium]
MPDRTPGLPFRQTHAPIQGPSTWSMLACAVLATMLLGSCVGNRKIVLLQDKDAGSPQKALVDKKWVPAPPAVTIRSGDVLMVNVDHTQLVQNIVPQAPTQEMNLYRAVQHPYLIGYTVAPDGTINLPELGSMKVEGIGLPDAEKLIQAKADSFYTDATVKVMMLNFNISVLGEVGRPGRYPVYNNEVNVLEGVAMAGDLTVLADRSRIRVVRTREGSNHLYHLDLNDQDLLGSPAFYLEPNDVVIVDPLKRRKFTGKDPGTIINILAFLVSIVSVYAVLNR